MFHFLDIIFPPKCLHCKKEGDLLCQTCFDAIQLKQNQVCPICKKIENQGEVCLNCKERSALDGLLVATNYAKKSLIKKIITQFKYKYSENLSKKLADLLYLQSDLSGICKQKNLHPLFKKEKNTKLLVPVPLHFLRKWQRGFNQAELLAKQFSKKSQIPFCKLLKRTKNTSQQAKLSREKRLENLRGAFVVDGKKLNNVVNFQKRKAETPPCPLKGVSKKLPTILLIDDVASTLSTLEECATVLKKNGFEKVWGLVIARG